MRPVRALLLSLLYVATIFGAGHAYAQDPIPETPPELRDFRLDPERAQPQPQPTPVTPPPVVSTVPQEQPATAAPARTQPTRRQPETARPVGSTEQEPVQAEPETTTPTVEQAEPVTLPEAAPVTTEAEIGTDWNYGLLGGIAGAILIGLLGLWLALRRRRQQSEEQPYVEPVIEPAAPAVVQPPARPPVTKPMASKPEPAKSPDIALAFAPEKATISFTTLTVRGQLQIANDSVAMAKDMQLRAGLISASNRQQLAMNAFFAAPDISANALGDAKPGEKLSMAIELTVPLTEMQSFPMGDQRLLVPIMVAELAYQAEDGADQQVRLACMLGREARPPQPKMGPLRLDQGPRSFAPLGQRPLAA